MFKSSKKIAHFQRKKLSINANFQQKNIFFHIYFLNVLFFDVMNKNKIFSKKKEVIA